MTDLLELAGPDVTLLTVNKRLAAELRSRYDAVQLARGHRVWPSADVVPWDAWLARHYDCLLDAGRIDRDLLSVTQERLLWQDVIQADPQRGELLRPSAAAQAAQTTAQLYADWQLGRFELATLGGDETRIFLAWQEAFRRRLEQRRQMTRAQLLPMITAAFADGVLKAPRLLLQAGFDTLSPAQQALLDALGSAGCDVRTLVDGSQAAVCRRTHAADTESEICLAAQWAAQRTREAPGSRVAIVAPQIAQQKDALDRIFSATLTPTRYLQRSDTRRHFNISLGDSLAACPLVDTALRLFDVLRGEHPLSQFGQLLRSPFLGGHATEWGPRALFDAALRDDGLPSISLRRLRVRLGQYPPDDACHCPRLAANLDALSARLDELPAQDTPNAWAGHLHRVLFSAGWPGDTPLDSDEYQQHERFKRAFSELATLGKVRGRVRLGDATALLRGIAEETLFQPESAPAAVQILGPLEAAGMRFDAIWLLDMHDQAWPPAPHPDPLLPSGLQRELGMPHASAERELAFAARLTDRLIHACDELIASHAQFDGERERRPSPLIRDWALLDRPTWRDDENAGLASICGMPPAMQALASGGASPAAPDQPGGAGLLAAQAVCPFQAVARYRLRAQPLTEPGFAADSALLGTLIHELLQRVWQRLGDSARLAAHDREALHALVAPLAVATLDDIGRRRPDLFTPRLKAIEARRLTALILDWLEVERGRAQPFRVSALERRQTIELAGLTLQTRADRIDELADGSLAVIDYKTGRHVSHRGWFDERVTEPQLPLYCVADGAPVSAALLARVRADAPGCRFVGLSRDEGFADGVETAEQVAGLDWAHTVAHWQRALATLAAEVVDGRADPTPSPEACGYCPLGALCRVAELTGEAADD